MLFRGGTTEGGYSGEGVGGGGQVFVVGTVE